MDDGLLPLVLSLGLVLGLARLLGEIARSLRMPIFIGEVFAGLILGPTVAGRVWPSAHAWLFSSSSSIYSFANLGAILLVAVAGLEVDLSFARERVRTVAIVAAAAIVVPLVSGCAVCAGCTALALHPAACVSLALSVSALPVLAKTLIDLGLYKTEIGRLIMAASSVTNLVVWVGLSAAAGPPHGMLARALVTGLALGVLVGPARSWIARLVARIEDNRAAPERVLSLVVMLSLLGAALAQTVGVHAMLGSFAVGLAMGGPHPLRPRTRASLQQIVATLFAPVFFASLGLRMDVARAFDVRLALIVLLVASFARIGSAAIAGRIALLTWREAIALGFGLNSHGGMAILVGVAGAASVGVDEKMLVAIVVMAIVTSLVAGPVMKALLNRAPDHDAAALFRRGGFVSKLEARTPAAAIHELAEALGPALGDLAAPATCAVIDREREAPTALGDEVAIPHAPVEGLTRPLLALGRAPRGIDFDAPDGKPVRVVFLLLLPPRAYEEEVHLLASIARSIFDAPAREALLAAEGFEEVARVLEENTRRTRRNARSMHL